MHLNLWMWVPLLCSLFFVLWLLQGIHRNASIADVGFCLGFLMLVFACGLASTGHVWRRVLVVGMASLYALRLGSHLFCHRVWNHSEDARYEAIRKWLGSWESVGIFCYFQLQVPACVFFAGLLCWVMEHPDTAWRWWDALGLLIFLIAIAGEGIADRQLQIFRANPSNHGKTLQMGLWRYSRHPNYFFESLYWSAFVPLAVGLPWSGLAVLWPLIMTGSLLWITGVPWAEAEALVSRGEDYRAYQRNTNRFFPWVPKRG